jgi:hypothetical protein
MDIEFIICKGLKDLTLISSIVEAEKLTNHIGSEKTPIQLSTAVRNIGQWSKDRTSNLKDKHLEE